MSWSSPLQCGALHRNHIHAYSGRSLETYKRPDSKRYRAGVCRLRGVSVGVLGVCSLLGVCLTVRGRLRRSCWPGGLAHDTRSIAAQIATLGFLRGKPS